MLNPGSGVFIRGFNTDVLTAREKKIQFIKGHLKRSDTLAAILALICAVLCYYEVLALNPDTAVIY